MFEMENKSTEELLSLAEHDPEAQFQLGLNYGSGDGVKQDWEKCAEWYRKAAEQGHADAQYTMFMTCTAGQGVPKDTAEAIKWCVKAAAQGHKKAKDKIRELAPQVLDIIEQGEAGVYALLDAAEKMKQNGN